MSILEISNLYFKYQNSNKFLLKNISLKINDWQHIAITGDNAQGKSTLFKLIVNYLKPVKGEIKIFNELLFKIKPAKRARLISYLPQINLAPFGWKVKEILQFALYNNNDNKDLIDYYMHFFDLNFIKDEQVDKLSGGQLQKLYLARTFIQNTKIILLDEPSIYLDLKSKFKLLQLIDNLKTNKLILTITHDLQFIEKADNVYIIRHGELLPEGSSLGLLSISKGSFS